MSDITPVKGREARLKPVCAHLYPSVVPGEWQSAALMTVEVANWLLRGASGRVDFKRILSPEHFEFRGASPKPVGYFSIRMPA